MLCLFITKVNAQMVYDFTYNEVKTNINTVITKYNNYTNYFRIPIGEEHLKYVYNNKILSYDTSYQNSGLLNLYEFVLCGGKNSYLYDSNNYWMLTTYDTDNTYMVDNDNTLGYSYKANTSKEGARITTFIKSNTSLLGNGSYSNPWYFK